jgi:signal transduction histidine kinase/ligand-binding sensor domain-containing protein/DNA-binding response OmpR family regulator
VNGYAYRFKKYQVNNGLSENSVQAIIQDHLGFMWFGTKDGLNRFDGHEFKIYKNVLGDSLSLGHNYVRSIFQDSDHNLWVGTDTYLYHFNYEMEQFRRFSVVSDLGEMIRSGVTNICPENDSTLWIGTMKRGVFCYYKNTGKLKQYLLTDSDNTSIDLATVWCINCDSSGNIWLGTRNGISCYNREIDRFSTYNLQHNQRSFNPNNETFVSLEMSDGNLWFGTWANGVYCINPSSHTFRSFLNEKHPPSVLRIYALLEYDASTLMVGSYDGLYLLDKETGVSRRVDNMEGSNSLSEYKVFSLCRDREGGIWVGTYFGGVSYISLNTNIIEHYYSDFSPFSLSGKVVSQFCEDEKGNLWIATEDGGLNYFDVQTKRFKVFLPEKSKNSLSYHNIHSLAMDGEKLWIGTFSSGVDVLDLKTGRFKNYMYNTKDTTSISDGCVFAIYKDSHGDIWLGTSNGLCRYNRLEDNFVRVSDVPVFVFDIQEDAYGSLWVASYFNGAYRYEYASKKWRNYTHNPYDEKSITFDKLTDVYFDGKGRLWFATEGRGICKYNYKTDDFTTIDENSGLPNSLIYSILDDKYDNLWLSGNRGITRLDLTTMKRQTYTREDGLQGNEFNYRSGYKSNNGLFYFGGTNGFNVFNPDDLLKNSYVPPVVITSVELLYDGRPQKIKPSGTIRLKHNQASFRINFSALSYQAPSKNLYAYKMEGMDTKWTELDNQKMVSFTNLRPGKYIFRIKGSNNDEVWNETGTSLRIIVSPPFWESNIAFVIYALLGIASVVSIFFYYSRYHKRKELQRLEQFRRKKDKELYESKIGFFTTIAHEIRTPLSLIKAPLECITNSGDGTSETKENLVVIERNTDRLLELINQLLDFRKVEQDFYQLTFKHANINELLQKIYLRFKSASEYRKIDITLQMPEQPIFIAVDKEALTKIVSNLLSNALKYTDTVICIGLVKIHEHIGNYIEITVSDDGIGIPDEMKEAVFEPFVQIENDDTTCRKTGTGIGLVLVKQLTEKHGGAVSIMDNPNKGVTFKVKIPMTVAANDEPVTIDEPETWEAHVSDQDKISILFVEDNNDLCDFVAKNLGQSYKLFLAANGKEALRILEKKGVNLIISDIMMPEMDGLGLTKTIKQDQYLCHIPIILLSAKTNTKTKVEGLEYGADSYIEKPFSISFLQAQINSLLENRKKIMDRFSHSPVVYSGSIAHNTNDEVFLKKLDEKIDSHMIDEQFSVEKLAVMLSMSQSNLQRKIKGLSGISPANYIQVTKLKKAAQLIASGKYRINEVCYITGFSSPSYFTSCFQKQFGMSPKEFMKLP